MAIPVQEDQRSFPKNDKDGVSEFGKFWQAKEPSPEAWASLEEVLCAGVRA